MSEPLSTHEIEDVLSSIRRLVSEELRPSVRPPAAAAPAPAADEGKLLLTPALRIVETPVVAVPEAVAPDESYGDEVYDDAGLEEGGSGLRVLLDTSGDAGAQDELLWAASGHVEGAGEDTAVDGAEAAEAPSRGHWTAETVPQVEWIGEDTDDWVEETPPAFVPRRRATVEDEPLARAWAERAEAEVRAELQDDVTPVQPGSVPRTEAAAPAEGGGGLFDQEETLFDEEMLRDMVREIIREELAGTLGERITRNVRKLVRVEVNRALTAREFE